MAAYVYLLWHKSEPRFKIGKADNLAARVIQLGVKQFDLTRAEALEVDNCVSANNLERILHRAFRAHRLIPGETAPESCPGLRKGRRDGDTEWFDEQCWDRLHLFLEQNQDLFGHIRESPERVAEQVALAAQQVQSAERRRAARKPIRRNAVVDTDALLRRRIMKERDALAAEASQAGTALEALRHTSDFVAVLKADDGYKLVGEIAPGREDSVKQAMGALGPLVTNKNPPKFSRHKGAFMVSLCGAPGRSPDEAPSLLNWAERLAWSHEPGIPGFDLTLNVEEMRKASRLLKDTFKTLSKPVTQMPVSIFSAD